MREDVCYAEFENPDTGAIQRLGELWSLVQEKLADGGKVTGEYLAFFTEEELDTFWWPDAAEAAETAERWGRELPIRVSATRRNRSGEWDVYSMLEIISQSDYEIGPLEHDGANTYRLTFIPRGYPYGGTESLQRLARAFGGDVVAVDDGTGRIDPRIHSTPRASESSKEVQAPSPQSEQARRKKPWWRFW